MKNFLDKQSIFHNYFYCKEFLLFSFILITLGYTKIGLLFLGILIFFFRNTSNMDLKNKSDIISPSSSKIMEIEKMGLYQRIFTYLSPLDRHFMVAPVDCKVINIDKKLEKDDAERITVEFEDKDKKRFKLSQIVKKLFKGYGVMGSWVSNIFYKNRIVCFCKKGDKLKKGERWGLIRFGSSMEYMFPKSYKLNLKIGEHLSLGKTIGNMYKKITKKPYKEDILDDMFEKASIWFFVIGFATALIIFCYGKYRCDNIKTHKDLLGWNLFKNSKDTLGLDGWTISHFVFYMILALIYPFALRLNIISGICWELFEYWVGKTKPDSLKGWGFCKNPNSKKNSVWWYGRKSDIVANILGALLGKFMKLGYVF